MKLTKKNMKAAHIARQIDSDPNAATHRAYDLGKKVLAEYTLTYSPRFRRGTVPPDIPSSVIEHITVSAGHVAHHDASRFAMFRKRK